MNPAGILLLFAGGCLAGFLAGFFGVGGGILLVPLLLWFYQETGVSSLVATHLAFGTSLFVIIFAAFSSTLQYRKNDHVVWRAVFILGVTSVVAALAGSLVAGALSGKVLQRIFALVVMVSALRLFSEQRKPKGDQPMNTGVPPLALTGILVGMVSSLAGVGGGVLSIPVMYTLLRFPLMKALGTSSATIVITAVASTAGYVIRGLENPLLPPATLGFVDYLHAVPLVLGTIPLSRAAASLAHRTPPATLRKAFATFLLIVAARMLFF